MMRTPQQIADEVLRASDRLRKRQAWVDDDPGSLAAHLARDAALVELELEIDRFQRRVEAIAPPPDRAAEAPPIGVA
ncbi:MAG: hypothetical protein VYD87_04400 [Pseudomonadota bacterium]|nr:hypothetical protein [Pseudomonadota bacterium]MEE3098600.1 hypothetical protein [Pseudomonadota bacterium]